MVHIIFIYQCLFVGQSVTSFNADLRIHAFLFFLFEIWAPNCIFCEPYVLKILLAADGRNNVDLWQWKSLALFSASPERWNFAPITCWGSLYIHIAARCLCSLWSFVICISTTCALQSKEIVSPTCCPISVVVVDLSWPVR